MGDQQEIHFFDDDALFVPEPNLRSNYTNIIRRFARSTITGDCTPSYMYHEPAAEEDLEIQSKDKIIDPFAKSGRPRLCALEHATIQRLVEPLDFFDAVARGKNAYYRSAARSECAALRMSGRGF